MMPSFKNTASIFPEISFIQYFPLFGCKPKYPSGCTRRQEDDNFTTPYYPFSLHYLSSGRLWEVKNKGKFQTFSAVAYERWSLTRGSKCSDLTW